jgi:hypothetical protein
MQRTWPARFVDVTRLRVHAEMLMEWEGVWKTRVYRDILRLVPQPLGNAYGVLTTIHWTPLSYKDLPRAMAKA